jgi:hypothetical protein
MAEGLDEVGGMDKKVDWAVEMELQDSRDGNTKAGVTSTMEVI